MKSKFKVDDLVRLNPGIGWDGYICKIIKVYLGNLSSVYLCRPIIKSDVRQRWVFESKLTRLSAIEEITVRLETNETI